VIEEVPMSLDALDYEIHGMIGRGSFGQVYSATCKANEKKSCHQSHLL